MKEGTTIAMVATAKCNAVLVNAAQRACWGKKEKESSDLLHFLIFVVQMLLPQLNSHYQCNVIGHGTEERRIQSAPLSC